MSPFSASVKAALMATLAVLGACNVEPLTAASLYGPRDPNVATLSGLITDARSGAPLAGAVAAAAGTTALSDAGGAYLIEGLPPGEVDLTVARDGYETAMFHLTLPAGGVLVQNAPLAPIPCSATGCTVDDFCSASTGRCEPRTGAASASGVVRDACTGAAISARVTAARRSTCSTDGGKAFWQLTDLPAGGPQILAAAKGGYRPFATEVTLLPGPNTVPPLELTPDAGCGAPMPADVACSCTDPQCQ